MTIPHPTQPPPAEPRPTFACQKGTPIPPQTRRAGRTLPHILSRDPVNVFVDDSGRRAGSPSYSRKPTFAHTCGNRVSSQCMDAALQQLMSMGAVRRKSPSGMDVPTLFGRQPMQTSTKPA